MPAPHGYIEKLAELTQEGRPFVAVTLVEAIGSTPQDAGSKMLVSTGGLEFGTVGGGRIEHRSIQYAQELLSQDDSPETSFIQWNLQTDIGMTCGGTVKLFFETYNHQRWRVVVFGAGHVAKALVQILVTLDCQVYCFDPRQEWIDRLPASPNLSAVCDPNPSERVIELDDQSFVLCMTMGHKTDRPILEEIFRQERRFPYLGVIGSQSKRKVLLRELTTAGIPKDVADQFHCPIGLDVGSNQPGEIAISVAAQLLGERDRVKT